MMGCVTFAPQGFYRVRAGVATGGCCPACVVGVVVIVMVVVVKGVVVGGLQSNGSACG